MVPGPSRPVALASASLEARELSDRKKRQFPSDGEVLLRPRVLHCETSAIGLVLDFHSRIEVRDSLWRLIGGVLEGGQQKNLESGCSLLLRQVRVVPC